MKESIDWKSAVAFTVKDPQKGVFMRVWCVALFAVLVFTNLPAVALAQSSSCPGIHVKILDTQASCDFVDIPPGTYALAVIHDENMDGKLDTKGNLPGKDSYLFNSLANPAASYGKCARYGRFKEGLKPIAYVQWEEKMSEEVCCGFDDDRVRWSGDSGWNALAGGDKASILVGTARLCLGIKM